LSLVPIPENAEDRELVSILTSDSSLFRFLPNFYHGEPLRDVLEFNAPIGHQIQSVSGYDTPPLRSYWEFLLEANGYAFWDVLQYTESIPPIRNRQALNFLNVKYILAPMNTTLTGFRMIKEHPVRGWRLYENPDVSPRFFMVSQAPPRRGVSFDLQQTCVGGGQFRPVDVVSYTPNTILLKSNNTCDGYLVSSETYYPGWRATIDGKETPVFEGNIAFRTIFLPAGAHRIEFSYRPTIVLVGAAVSTAAILLAIFLVVI
ncbi:YfhO family protein, partial [Candidatus Gottesmanbacteria bacterium]|nr:YfhO family protein [Candidatus Gottesmanbacteria bacterium]